jgi:hypothetical protein
MDPPIQSFNYISMIIAVIPNNNQIEAKTIFVLSNREYLLEVSTLQIN